MSAISIAWIDLTFKVKNVLFGENKTILNRINGCVEFGSITALMGPSGAGKTTLLKCLNGKLSSGIDPESKIFLCNDREIKPCFVSQHSKEHLIMCLTAKENLIFASKLKNSDIKANIDHNMNMKTIMEELMISDISDTPVDHCSGGEQKRLTIAVEMTKVDKPNLSCIDEPTTGLDSNNAEIVSRFFKNLIFFQVYTCSEVNSNNLTILIRL